VYRGAPEEKGAGIPEPSHHRGLTADRGVVVVVVVVVVDDGRPWHFWESVVPSIGDYPSKD
jgi:hypothetical protein